MDDEQLLKRIRSILMLTQEAEKKAKNMKVGLSLNAARCHLASALTTLENEYGDKVRDAYDKAHLDHQARLQQ